MMIMENSKASSTSYAIDAKKESNDVCQREEGETR